MRNKHLDEIEIQQYLFEEHNFPPDIDEHIKHCKECRIRAEQYRLIFELVRDQKKPVFDFMLDKLVMKLVNENKTEYSFGKILIYYIVLIAVPVTAAAIYLFRTTLSDLLTGLAPILIYLIITTGISVLLFQCLDIFLFYKKRMDVLNFYSDLQL